MGGRAARKALRAAPKTEEEKPVLPGMLGGRYKPLSDADMARVHEATMATLENIGRMLDGAGLDFADLVKCTVFLADVDDYAAMNEVYVTFFEGLAPPARSAVAVGAIAFDARVEIECIAAGR